MLEVRKGRDTMVRKSQSSQSRFISALVGGLLLALGLVWLGLLLLSQHQSISHLPALSIPGLGSTSVSVVQIPQLATVGITLSHTNQTPTLSQQQVLLIASELEPEAASKAKNVSAQYVLVTSASTLRTSLNKTPAWMIWYQQIPLEPADAAVDPTPYPHSYHDLYIFLDETTEKELLSIWV